MLKQLGFFSYVPDTVPYLYEKWTQGQLWGVKNWFWEMGINTGLEGEEKHKLRPNQLF